MTMNIKTQDIFRVYRNEKIAEFVESLPKSEQVVAHKVIQFLRTEFPECEDAIRGKLIHEEIS